MRGPDAGEALGLCLDHRAEVVATQGSLLLKAGSIGFQVVVGQGFVEKKGDQVHLQSFEISRSGRRARMTPTKRGVPTPI